MQFLYTINNDSETLERDKLCEKIITKWPLNQNTKNLLVNFCNTANINDKISIKTGFECIYNISIMRIK